MEHQTALRHPAMHSPVRVMAACVLALLLTACGGGSDAGSDPETPAQEKSLSITGAQSKVLATRIPVYRFYNTLTGAHFYTTSETERATLVNTMPQFRYDGIAFYGASAFVPGLSPVYRFYNTQTGVHFYTISEAEKNSIVANLPHYHLDGVAYHASATAGAGLQPLYRFFMPRRGFHFYTASETEKATLQNTQSATYTYEGPAYYVLATDWRAEKLPHTGIASTQCFAPGTSTLTSCSGSTVLSLNSQQDGHRATINPMSFSPLRLPAFAVTASGTTKASIYYPTTSCVRDDVTGLVWEGKTDDGGLRDKDNTYTNLGNGTANDASGYVAAVNAAALCGFNDWRMPTANELMNIRHFGRAVAPYVDVGKFPNTIAWLYWAAERNAYQPSTSWMVSFGDSYGAQMTSDRTTPRPVRLVRGKGFSGPRFSVASVPYSTDAASNVVNDAWTGLQWRRCAEGQTWTGSACSGTATKFSHQAALAAAAGSGGWRLPNAKELASLHDTSRSSGLALDPVAFPGIQESNHHSSTPNLFLEGETWQAGFGGVPNLIAWWRTNELPVRLVR